MADSDATDTEVSCLESMDDDEIDRLKAFVLAVWTFTVTSLSAYRGKRGLDPKGAVDHKEADDDEPSLPARSQGCTGAAEEEVVARRLAAMKAKFNVEGDRRLYTTKPGAEPMDVTCAPSNDSTSNSSNSSTNTTSSSSSSSSSSATVVNAHRRGCSGRT